MQTAILRFPLNLFLSCVQERNPILWGTYTPNRLFGQQRQSNLYGLRTK